jgi:hypothetical protein
MRAAIPNGKFSVMPMPVGLSRLAVVSCMPQLRNTSEIMPFCFTKTVLALLAAVWDDPRNISAMKKALSKAVPLESAEPFEVSEQEPEFSRKEEALAPTKFGAKISAGNL